MLPVSYAQMYVNDGFTYCLETEGYRELWPHFVPFSHSSKPLDMSCSLHSMTNCQKKNSVRSHSSAGVGHSSNMPTTSDNKPGYTRPNISVKPQLTFSIDRILGLNAESENSPRNDDETGSFVENGFDEDSDNEIIDVDDVKEEEPTDLSTDNTDKELSDLDTKTPKYQWLQCTRYHPPKLQRNKQKDGGKKRKLGRNPRVPFTQHQVVVLEDRFKQTHYLSSLDVAELSTVLGLTEPRVKIWFQNRRARDRREKEAVQNNQKNTTQRTFLPLSVPSVSWPNQASITAANYMQSSNSSDFRPNYISSSFRV